MEYKYTKLVDSALLSSQIKANSAITRTLVSITFSGLNSETTIKFNENLTSQGIDALNTIVASHNPNALATQKYIEKKLLAAMNFGQTLMVEYGAKNVMAGLTTQQVRQVSDKLADLQRLLLSGSLYCALAEMDNITPDSLITQATIDEFKAKIQAYLGI